MPHAPPPHSQKSESKENVTSRAAEWNSPEIRLADTPSPAPLGNRPCPSNGKKPSATTLPSESDQEMMGWCSPAGERKNCNGGADKHSVISSWIADCRTAWHEAKMKASRAAEWNSPEIRLADTPSPAPLGNRPCPSNGKKPSATTLPSESDQEMMGWCSPAGERKNCNGGADKHSVISSWIADCRTAWHEAKMKACMLPTIAEI
ncbi:hypothetical protein SKAU_G00365210 [Synaphobranchus kaupii]|uniref:Uncharacterized protein n=1 Tax=Synaphobranchus kaupii TaxID=118154 RepID=A0A9Q1EEX9_SYNKA|nr:hypothetical protein SKAU_G00365210 [Synaphobranchus kaupii]